jgi:hypothetical protein
MLPDQVTEQEKLFHNKLTILLQALEYLESHGTASSSLIVQYATYADKLCDFCSRFCESTLPVRLYGHVTGSGKSSACAQWGSERPIPAHTTVRHPSHFRVNHTIVAESGTVFYFDSARVFLHDCPSSVSCDS